MSVHPGFPDISDGRRRSLLRLRREVKATGRIAFESAEQKSPSIRTQVDRLCNSIPKLERRVLMQFPEVRATEFTGMKDEVPETNLDLQRSLREIQDSIAICLEITGPTLRRKVRASLATERHR